MSTSISLSLELVCLMGWLLKHDKAALNALVKQAIASGLTLDLKNLGNEDVDKLSEQPYNIILDFLMYLEEALMQNLDHADHQERSMHKTDVSSDKIHDDFFTKQTIKFDTKNHKDSTQNNLTNSETDKAKKRLYEHIIKSWRPSKNEIMH